MQCVEELSPETLFDLDEIEALPAFDVPDFMPDFPAIAFTFTEVGTSSATTCTVSVTLVAENPYDGVFCFAQSPFGLCSEGTTEGLIGSAGVLEQAGQVRYNYNSFVAQLRATGAYSSERDALRAFFNQPGNSTALSRGVADMYRWEQGLNGASRSMANPTATAPAVNNAAAMARWGGRGLIVVGAGLSVYDIATAPDPYRATVQNGSAVAVGAGGASAGAWAGAGIGSLFGPGPGTAIGAVVGAIVGGVGGGVGGHALGTAAYDANYGPNSPW